MNDFRNVIAARRDDLTHSREDLEWLAKGAADGSIPDFQLTAWLMAAYLNPLDLEQTVQLTLAMADSGLRLDLTEIKGPVLDKHSTGGVGDKTSIVLLPLMASLGVTVVKMSGPGLGTTGGTVDKLASIPGFRLELTPSQMVEQAKRIGVALSGQTKELAPADKTLYGLRDLTETTASVPLIASSILSKKVAGGAKHVVIDVKCGSGGFMTDLPAAERLAKTLREVGLGCGLELMTEITDMSQPLGQAVGNALEVREALRVLSGESLSHTQSRFRELCIALAARALVHLRIVDDSNIAIERVDEAIRSGRAIEKARQWIHAQGGPGSIDEVLQALPAAPVQLELKAELGGWIRRLDARVVGEAVLALGGGRKRKSDAIDYSVGVAVHKAVGDPVIAGESILTIHARELDQAEEVSKVIGDNIALSNTPVSTIPLFLSKSQP